MLSAMVSPPETAPGSVPITAEDQVSVHTSYDRAPTSGLIVGRFAEPAGYTVTRPSGAQSWLLMITESGAGRVQVADRATVASRGVAALLPANIAHAYATAPGAAPWLFWWAHFQMRRSWLDRFPPDVRSVGFLAERLPEPVVVDLLTGFGRLHAAARWPGHGPLPAEVAGIDRVALAASDLGWAMAAPQAEMILVQLAAATQDGSPRPADDRVSRVLSMVVADPAAPHSVARLAGQVSLSPSRLAHVCTAELGRPLMHEVRRIRLEHAARLLTGTQLSVAQVARASGFASPFHFSRSFRAHFALAPTAYRTTQLSG